MNAMTKAYEIKNLLERCKAQGLELTEEAAKIFAKELIAWADDSAVISENKIDDIARIGYPELQKILLGLADKINPADNAAAAPSA